MKTPKYQTVVGRLSSSTKSLQTYPRDAAMQKFFGHTYSSSECPIHHCKYAETMVGRKWCPKCEGERTAKEVSKKLKLSLPKFKTKPDMPFEFYQVSSAYPKVTVDQFYKWWANPKQMYHCVFCSEHFEGRRPNFCPRCREYKGIEPCLQTGPDNNCQLDAGWKPD